MAFVFGIILIVSTFIDQNINDYKLNAETKKKDSLNTINQNLNKKNKILLDSLRKSSDVIINNTSQLKANTEKLTEISNIIYNKTLNISKVSEDVYDNTQEMTGNGSYPLATCDGQKFNNQFEIIVRLIGKYALSNLEVKVVIIEDYSIISGLDINILGLTNTETYNLKTLKKSEFKQFFIPYNSKEISILINFKSDNHYWNETLLISNSKNEKKVMWFIKDENGKTLEKHISKEFPVNKEGKIVLWSNVSKKFEDI